MVLGSPASAAAKGKLIIGIAPAIPEPYLIEEPEPELQKFQKRRELPSSAPSTLQLPTKMQAWTEASQHLARLSGLPLAIELPKTQLVFERKLAKGLYDFAYVTPMQLINFGRFPGYTVLAKRKAQPLRSVIVVKKFSDYKTFALLRDKSVAMGNPLDYGGSIIPRDALKRANFAIRPVFFASQDKALDALFADQAEAAAIGSDTYDATPSEIKGQLRVVWDSPGYTPYAFVVHPRIDSYSNLRLQRALVAMIKHVEARQLLDYIHVRNGFEAATDADWHDARNIDLEEMNREPAAGASQ
jgi:phosphonate transport system substrate-binding protein